MKSFLLGVLVTLVVAAGTVITLVSGGYLTIAASAHESSFLRWLLHSVYENTLEERAADVQLPENLDSPEVIAAGARDFDSMCSPCHTPPGRLRSAIHLGLSPQPPKLVELMDGRTPAEAFWVLDHGIRMTGMPAFGETHDDQQLWSLVAFIRDARTYTASQYDARVSEGSAAGHDGHDDHDDHQHEHFNNNSRAVEETGARESAEDDVVEKESIETEILEEAASQDTRGAETETGSDTRPAASEAEHDHSGHEH